MQGQVFPKFGIVPNISTSITTLSSANTWTRWPNTLGKAMRYFLPQAFVAGYGWAPLGWAGTLWSTVHTDYIYIYNGTGAAQDVWWAAID